MNGHDRKIFGAYSDSARRDRLKYCLRESPKYIVCVENATAE
jgi:hypothetical protein